MKLNKGLCPFCQEFSFIEKAEEILDTTFFRLNDTQNDYINKDAVNKNIKKLINAMKEYLICFQDIYFLEEINIGEGIFEILISPETNTRQTINIPNGSFGNISRELQGPLLITSKVAADLHEYFSKNLFDYDIDTGYVIFLNLSSGRSILIVLANKSHICRFRPYRDFCYQRDPRRLLFLKRLSRQIWAYFNLIEGFIQLDLERKTKEAYLTEAAHSLSLPLTSILIDSAILVKKTQDNSDIYKVARHQLDMIRDMELNVQNILRDKLSIDQELDYCFFFRGLSEACDMSCAEAADKGCNIIVSIIIDNREIIVDHSKIKNEEELYRELLYKPIFGEYLKLSKKSTESTGEVILTSNEVSTFLMVGENLEWIYPEKLPSICHTLVKENSIYEDTYILLKRQEFKKKLKFISEFYMPNIFMNEPELTLAFKNLIHNAVKYSYRAPRKADNRYVKVTIKRNIDFYHISISNYGIGITPDELKKGLIWKAGYRGKKSRDRNRPGSGLGLFHTKKIIEEIHKGSISAQSTLQRGGAYLTTFIIILPIPVN